MLTLQCKLILDKKDKKKLLDIMRVQSSAVRYAYNRLLESNNPKSLYTFNNITKKLQEVFKLNAKYSQSAVIKAKSILLSCLERSQNPRKVIFGGRELFEKLQKRHINGRQREKIKRLWQERRKGSLYSVGNKRAKGNNNVRFELEGTQLYLKINVGSREWIYAKVQRTVKREKDKWINFISSLLQAESTNEYFPYTVEIKLKDGEFYAFVSYQEKLPELRITKESGVLSIDLNASPLHIAYAEVDRKGNLNSYGEITLSEILNKDRNQIKQILWETADQIIELAKEKSKAIAIEKLNKIDKGQRGDGKGKLRKRLHSWVYKGLIEKIIMLAKRNGIQVLQVNPAYTSVIGALKYCPIYNITKDVAGAYVIGRRALGFKEKAPKNYKELLKDKEFLTHSLERLKEMYEQTKARYDKETNKYKRKAIKRELSSIRKWVSLINQSLKSEPGRVLEPLEGTSSGTHYHLWQVLKVALVISLLGKSFIRDFSPLRRIVVSKDWKGVASQVSSLSAWAGVQSVVNQYFGIF